MSLMQRKSVEARISKYLYDGSLTGGRANVKTAKEISAKLDICIPRRIQFIRLRHIGYRPNKIRRGNPRTTGSIFAWGDRVCPQGRSRSVVHDCSNTRRTGALLPGYGRGSKKARFTMAPRR